MSECVFFRVDTTLSCWRQQHPVKRHAQAGQTQINLLRTGFLFGLAGGMEKYFYEIRTGGNVQHWYFEHVRGARTSCHGISLYRTDRGQGSGPEKIWKPHDHVLPDRYSAAPRHSRPRCGPRRAVAFSSSSNAAAMMNSRWTHLYLWELSRSGHMIGGGQRSIFGRLLKPG